MRDDVLRAPDFIPDDRQRAATEQWVMDCGLFCEDCGTRATDAERYGWIGHLWNDPEPLPYRCPGECVVLPMEYADPLLDCRHDMPDRGVA